MVLIGIIPLNIGNLPMILNMMSYIYIIMKESKENELIKKRGIERNKRYREYFEKRHKFNKKVGTE